MNDFEATHEFRGLELECCGQTETSLRLARGGEDAHWFVSSDGSWFLIPMSKVVRILNADGSLA